MKLQRVPGVKRYRSLSQGLRIIGQSAEMSRASESAAESIAAVANDVGDSTYAARPQPVRMGHGNELRAGASVYEVEAHWKDARDAVLQRTAEAMARRSPRD